MDDLMAMQAQFTEAMQRIGALEQQTRVHQQAAAAASAHAAQLEQELERAAAVARDTATQDVVTILRYAVQQRPGGSSSSGLGKGLGTPERFSGVDEAWADWSFVVQGYIGAQSPQILTEMKAAATLDEPIQQVTLSPDEAERSRALFFALAMLTRGEALRKVKTVRD